MDNINLQEYKNSLLRQKTREIEEVEDIYVESLKEVKEHVEIALRLNSKSALSHAYCQLNKVIIDMEGK